MHTDDRDSIFCIPTQDVSHCGKPKEVGDCQVGGVTIPMYIDSGYKWSIMGLESWCQLEDKSVQHFSFNYEREIRTFYASLSVQYDVLFTVSCEICCYNSSIIMIIVVMREKFAVILGGNDAKALHLLRVGLNAVPDNP